jgi:hypothetical protein
MSHSSLHSKIECIFDGLSLESPPSRCAKCGCKMMSLSATFFTPGPQGKIWAVPLPVCPRCYLKERAS